jgi:predicted TPR repeat methyltransferase
MSWSEYWNGETTIYVNQRHRAAHYQLVAQDIIAMLPGSGARAIDYGCGEALHADAIAARCSHLYLCDASQAVRTKLEERFAGRGTISIVSPQALEHVDDGTIDLIVANSVVQYLTVAELERALDLWRTKLAPDGRLVLADIIPRDVGALTDVIALLRFARSEGFLVAAGAGLLKTFFSSYRRTRIRVGMLRFDEHEIVELLARCGFAARRRRPNFGHNPARMALVAQLAQQEVAAVAPSVA